MIKITKQPLITFNVLVHSFVDTWQCLPLRSLLEIDGTFCDVIMNHGITTGEAYELGHGPNYYDLIIDYNRTACTSDNDLVEVSPRLLKIEQVSLIAQRSVCPNNRFENLEKVPTWDLSTVNTASGYRANTPVKDGSKYIVRPNLGARGMAMFIVDTSKTEPSFAFTNLQKMVTDEFLKSTETQLAPGVIFVRGDYRHDGEVKNILGGEAGLFIQKMIPNITAEYRFITGHGEVEAILKRATHEVCEDVTVVSSAGRDEIIFLNDNIKSGLTYKSTAPWHRHIENTNIENLDEIRKFVIDKLPPRSSIDVFTTKEGKWGIFEFSNQFHLEDLPQEWVVNMHKKWLAHLLKERYVI